MARLGAVTFGLWRRYSHFEALNEKVTRNFRREDYSNTHWSWRCLRRTKVVPVLGPGLSCAEVLPAGRFLHHLVFEAHARVRGLFELEIASHWWRLLVFPRRGSFAWEDGFP